MMKTVSSLVVFLWLLATSLAFAAATKNKVVIIAEGADSDAVRQEVSHTFPEGLAAGAEGDLSAALANNGVKGSLADALANPKTRKQTLAGVRKALTQTGVPGVVSARGKKGKGGTREVRVVLIVKGQTEPVIEENIALGKGEKAGPRLQPLLSVPLQDIASVPAEEPKAAKTADKDKDKDKDEEKDAEKSDGAEASVSLDKDTVTKPRGPVDVYNAMIVAEAGAEIGTRQFKFSTPVRGPLRSYAAPAIGMAAIGVQIYPFATQGISGAKDIAIVGRFGQALPFESKTKTNTEGTPLEAKGEFQRFAVGARYRLRIGDAADAPLIGIEGVYGQWKFLFTGEDSVKAQVPSVAYSYVRGGADARIPVGPAAIYVGAGYMHILNAGTFQTEKFPHAKFGGVEGKVGAGYLIQPWLEARANVTYTRIFSSFNPKPGEQEQYPNAGGALDTYVVANLGVSALF
ncbi:MAG TPA: hypothetical protein VJT73_08595 [Polyangiaceae bacterium]|nr:hypothetical protein [Polyangiaceae bacterium]